MNGEHEPGLNPNEQAIMEKELPGRSLLEKRSDLALSEKEKQEDEHGHRTREIIKNEQNQPVYRKDIAYVKEKSPDGKTEQNTDQIKAISEQVFAYDDEGRVVGIQGTNLDREHSWENTNTYDEAGNLVSESGKVTEGEKQGETWEKTTSKEQVGNYEKVTVNNKGKHLENAQLVDFSTEEVKYVDGMGRHVWGYHEAGGQRTMEWGEKPADLQE